MKKIIMVLVAVFFMAGCFKSAKVTGKQNADGSKEASVEVTCQDEGCSK